MASEQTDRCDHGVVFDSETAKRMSVHAVRKVYPCLFGKCPKGCGFDGIAYASWEHYLSGDW
jgi:hypothetical protein